MLSTKYSYAVDLNHPLIRLRDESEKQLAPLCPKLVGVARQEAKQLSNSRLFIGNMKAARDSIRLSFLEQITGKLPESLQLDRAAAEIFLRVSGSELAKRYMNGTLEPELHTGNEAALAYARTQIELEKNPQQAVEESQLAANGTSDGLV